MKVLLSILIVAVASSVVAADWPMHRASPARTGSLDHKPGPKQPKILWTYESQENFIASPVTDGQHLYVSALGAFNTASLHALPLDGQGAVKPIWSKRPPYLKQPLACPPSLLGGKLIFGDGMHQSDGGTLHCLSAATGTPLWQLQVPGALVHLEGSPAVADNKVFIGAGAAGLLCVDLNNVTLDGQPTTLDAAAMTIEAKWKQLQDQYEKDKIKDPDFAVPPSEDALPKPQPKLLWQVGKDQWHIDSAPTLVADKLLVASAFLDHEKVGKRALFCLSPKDGSTTWSADLPHNPWAGPTVSGSTVLVGCSSIRFDPKQLPGQGSIHAFDLSGKPLWNKKLPGGVVSPIATIKDLAVFSSADGTLHGFSISDGAPKWTYPLKNPTFSAPALSEGAAYIIDLKCTLHAVNLVDGKPLWTIDLLKELNLAGSSYASPLLHNGRLYVATHNLDSPTGAGKTVVICIGDK